MDLRSRPSREDPPPESVRVLPPEAGSASTQVVSRPQSRAPTAGPVMLLLAVLVAGGAGLLYGYSLGDDGGAATEADASVATTVAATVPPTTAAAVAPFAAMDNPFTLGSAGHALPLGATEWLNTNAALGVALHPDGSLWSAGPGGVVQWDLGDGSHLRHTTPNGEGPIGARDVAITADGEVWVIGDTRISHWDGTEWQREQRLQAGRNAQLTGLAITGDGAVWIGSSDWERNEFGIHRAMNGSTVGLESYDVAGDMPMLRTGPDGSLWMVAGDDLWQFVDERWIAVGDTGVPLVDDFVVTPAGDVLIARERTVNRWDAGSLTPIPEDGRRLFDNVLGGFVRWIVVDRTGVPWVVAHGFGSDGESTELIRLDDLTRYPVPADFTSRPVAADDGTLWMGTDDGILGFDNGTWRSLRIDDGIPVRWADSMAVDADGTVWLAGGNEITSFDGESWSVIDQRDVLQLSAEDGSNGGTWVVSGPDGAIWVGMGCRAAVRVDATWLPIDALAGIEQTQFCWPIDQAVSPDGSLWLLVEASSESLRGIHRWNGTSWSRVAVPAPEIGVWDIAVAPDGTVWGSGQGVMRLDDGEWTTVLGGLDIETMAIAGDGSVWAAEPCWWCEGESGGIWRYADGGWDRVLDLRTNQLVAASDGTVWAVGHNADGLAYVWHHDAVRFRPVALVQPFSSIAVAPDGSVWVASEGRLLHIPGS